MLLRLADRLVAVELQAATNATAMRAIADSMTELRQLISSMAHDYEGLRVLSTDTLHSFEQMRGPIQGLLDLKTRISGAWLVTTALLMVVAYLLQPLLGLVYHLHLIGP